MKSHLTSSLWLRNMKLTITGATSSTRGPIDYQKNVAGAEKQLKSMVYRLTQERGRWPLLALVNVTDKMRETTPSLINQLWEFLHDQIEHSDKRKTTVGMFVTSAKASGS